MPGLSIGIDLGVETASICAIDDDSGATEEFDSTSRPAIVIQHLERLGAGANDVIGLESGGCGTLLTRRLREAGFTVRVMEARFLHGFLKLSQNKTDKNDARGIAEIVRSGATAVPDVLVKTEAMQMLRSELVLRHRLMTQRIALENALRGTLRLNGGRLGRVYSGTQLEAKFQEEVERLRMEAIDLAEITDPVVAISVSLRRTLEKMNRRMAARAKSLEVCNRFMEIPGVGSICALSFYTAIEDPHRFKDSADVGPYLGLVPKISQSGAMLRSGRISRMGNVMTRTHLVTAACSLLRQPKRDSYLLRWATKIVERSGRGKARVALARKMAIVMIAMWKSGESFRFEAA
jgi:transposase